MVAVSTMGRRTQTTGRKNFPRGIKLQTIAVMTMGLSVLILFSLEPKAAVLYQNQSLPPPPRSLHEMMPDTGRKSQLYSRHELTRPFTPNGESTRFGMVQRKALRTNFLDPSYEIAALRTELSNRTEPSSRKLYHPRVVRLDDTWADNSPIQGDAPSSWTTPPQYRVVEPMSFSFKNSTSNNNHGNYTLLDSNILPFERPFLEECEQRVDVTVHPTCNPVHELSFQDDSISILSTKGSWRTAWNVHNDTAVLKVLQWYRDFDDDSYQQHALDVMVSDILSSSPYIIRAYGYCGQSIVQEWAPTGGRDYVKSYDVRNRERLKIARDLARGLADLQALKPLPHDKLIQIPPEQMLSSQEKPVVVPPIVFAHNDINIANTIQMEGHLKWNDFNIGVLLRSRVGSNFTEDCGAPVKYRADLWRSPEEIHNTSYVQLQYSDIYGFGNILYQVMTRHQPWTHKEPEGILSVEQVAERKKAGQLPTIPEQYKNTTSKDLQAMLLATMSCYHPVPTKRLTAFELAYALGVVYQRHNNKKRVDSSLLRDLFYRH